MKHSQIIGVVAVFCLLGSCFLPWVQVASINKTFSGVYGTVNENLNFGRQIIAHCIFAVFLVPFFLIPKIWAKRANIFFGLINFGWAIKNYIIFSMCRQGDCPQVKPGLYLMVFFALIVQLMVLLPKMEIKQNIN